MAEEKDDFKVDIVDDTPPEDRGRQPLPKEVREDLDSDDLSEYSEKVKNRINTARKAYHDERREKESALREREEALRFAQQAYEENRLLKQRLTTGEKIFAEETTNAANIELNAAKEALKRAYESGASDAIAEAQEKLTDAKLKLRDVAAFKPSLQQDNFQVQTPQQTQAPPPNRPTVDPKAEQWREKNKWFGADEEMTALALGLHEKLVRSGVDPRSDDYYERVDKTMRKRFPDYFGESQENNDEPSAPRKVSTVVAPATRSTAPRQVRLTASEAAIAKRLGLTPEAYAREKMRLETNNG
jgi:hypothetical protein